jgi:type IV pilus assembly protein PilO
MKLLFEIVKLKKKSFAFVLALLMINVFLYSYISTVQQARIETLQNNLLEKRRQRAFGPENKAFVYSQGLRDLTVFRSNIPPKKEFGRVVGELFETAANNGLSVGNVGYKPELTKKGGLLVYSLAFGVTGSYAAIKSFVSDIERTKEILFIDHLILNRTNATQEAVSLKIQISAYFRTEGQ